MAETLIERAEQLLAEGNDFNFGNCCTQREPGVPVVFSSKYISWKTRVELFVTSVFDNGSPILRTFKKSEGLSILGHRPDSFERHKSLIIAALETAIHVLQHEPPAREGAQDETVSNSKVFVVHGHDERLKNQLEIFLTEVGLDAVVLHRKADEGLTVIEKFEKHSDVGYAFVLLTPDDIGYPVSEESKADAERKKEKRARQNVIFEFGYFVAKLGRRRVCCLYKEGVSLPTDVAGVVYKRVLDSVEEVAFSVLKDLQASGYKVKLG